MADQQGIQSLDAMLRAMRVQQTITLNEAGALLQEMHTATGQSVWPGLSGNDVCAFANLVLARHSHPRDPGVQS